MVIKGNASGSFRCRISNKRHCILTNRTTQIPDKKPVHFFKNTRDIWRRPQLASESQTVQRMSSGETPRIKGQRACGDSAGSARSAFVPAAVVVVRNLRPIKGLVRGPTPSDISSAQSPSISGVRGGRGLHTGGVVRRALRLNVTSSSPRDTAFHAGCVSTGRHVQQDGALRKRMVRLGAHRASSRKF